MTQTERKYAANVGKLFYNTSRKRLCLVESVTKTEYSKKYRYHLYYLGHGKDDKAFTKNIFAKDFLESMSGRFIEITSEEEYKKILDADPYSILR